MEVRDPSPKNGNYQTRMTSESETGKKEKAVLSGLLHLLQARDLDDVGMIVLLRRGVGLEEPASGGLVQC